MRITSGALLAALVLSAGCCCRHPVKESETMAASPPAPALNPVTVGVAVDGSFSWNGYDVSGSELPAFLQLVGPAPVQLMGDRTSKGDTSLSTLLTARERLKKLGLPHVSIEGVGD